MKRWKNNNSFSSIIYGKHPFFLALKNRSLDFEKIYTSNLNEVENFIIKNNLIIKKCLLNNRSNSELNKMLPDINHQGYIGYIKKQKYLDFQDFINEKCADKNNLPRIIILDQLTDPHNIGAIIRTSLAFNIKYIIKTKYNSPKDMSIISKTSAGLSEFINLIEVQNLNNAIESLKKVGYFIIGLAGEARNDIKMLNDSNNIGIVIGNEGSGIRSLVKKSCDMLCKITMSDDVESLNVSVAAAIVIYKLWEI